MSGAQFLNSELTEKNNDQTLRDFKFLTPKIFSPDFPFFRGSVRPHRSPWLRLCLLIVDLATNYVAVAALGNQRVEFLKLAL